jgi:hypothetical protein
MRISFIALLAFSSGTLHAQVIVRASAPEKVAVTIYRDPDRGAEDAMDRDLPAGFAMISETRTVTLPPGRATIRFEGVAESMVSITAIVTGLPGGAIEKNRDAALLSPASLIDGTLGNRVTIRRTNPASGKGVAEDAIVRTRADGGLVLQTRAGYEAVRCAGLPEKLVFDRIPDGLSAVPQFTISADTPSGGTYQVTLSYLAAGFDWQAHYVATLGKGKPPGSRHLEMLAWLTLANDNGQSFADAELLAVAGTIAVEQPPSDLAEPAEAPPLNLTCYPLGSTATGIPLRAPPAMVSMAAVPMSNEDIVVTGSRMVRRGYNAATPVMVAAEEQLGDLKLYRVPEPVTVSAQSLKQVAFLHRDDVRGELIYVAECNPDDGEEADPAPLGMLFTTRNDKVHGLGAALPAGQVSLFEPSAQADLLISESRMRDYAVDQDIELDLGESGTVFGQCRAFPVRPASGSAEFVPTRKMTTTIHNANARPVRVRIVMGAADDWRVVNAPGKVRLKDGHWTKEVTVPKAGSRTFSWSVTNIN